MTHSAGWQQRQLWLVNAWYLSRIGSDSSVQLLPSENSPHCVQPLKDIQSQCPTFPRLQDGRVAKPQQGSLQLTQRLLSCDQEDQDHPLTVVWLSRYRRQDPTVAIFPPCEESRWLVVTMGNDTARPCSDSSFCLSQGLTFPLHTFFFLLKSFIPPFAWLVFSSCHVKVKEGMVTSVKDLFFCLCSFFFHGGKLLSITTVTAQIEFCFLANFQVTMGASIPKLSFLLLTKYPCDRRHLKCLNVPLFPFHYQNKYNQ